MKTSCVVFLAAIAIAGFCTHAVATDYFVSNSGDDNNPGTISEPWEHITYALTQVGPGDTINVRAGVYPEGRIWIDNLRGNPDGYITLLSYDGDYAAKITGGIAFWQCHYMKLIGFDMEGGHNGIVHIQGDVSSDPNFRSQYIYVQRCYVHHPDGQTDLVKTNQSDYLYIEDCELAHNGGVDQVIDMVWVTYSVGRRNYVYDWGDHALFTKGGCMYCTYEDNVIVDAIPKKSDQATRFGGTTQIQYHNPATPYQSEYTVYRNNIISGAANGANGTYDCYYAYFYNNTVHNCGSNRKGIVIQHSDYGSSGWSRHLFYFNNVFLDTDGDMGTVYAYENGNYEDWQTGNNNYYNNGNPIPSGGIVDPNQEGGATFGNPNLANPTGTATTYQGWLDLFRITENSTDLIDKGNSNAGNTPCPGVLYDIEGTSRPQGGGWDIGAFEYVGGPVPPVAEFSGNPTEGNAPLTVYFTDLSTGNPTSWDWSFGDTGTSQEQHPSHVYQNPNTYTVSLTVENAVGQDTETKPDYITVTEGQAPVADFSGSPTTGPAPLSVDFTDLSSGSPTSWDWTFGDGGSSQAQHPTHEYQNPNSYTVGLTAANQYGQDTETKVDYITVTEGGEQDYFCTSLEVTAGSIISGDHTSVHASDDVYLEIASEKVTGKHTTKVTYTFDTGLSSLSSLTVTSESHPTAVPQRQTIYVYNFTTSQWGDVDVTDLTSTTDTTTVVPVSSPSPYLSGTGQVQVYIRTGDRANTPWTHYIDLVKITAAP